MLSRSSPQIMLIIIDVVSSNIKTGIMKVNEKMNLKMNVNMVASQISFTVCMASASSDICMPSASENASATAMVSIPPITASFECVPECRPTINPRVVIIPDVDPKLIPTLNECFMVENFLVYLRFKGFLFGFQVIL